MLSADLPRLIDLYKQKKLKLDELVTRTYALDDVNEAMTALEKGEVIRSVIVMSETDSFSCSESEVAQIM